MRRTLSKSQQSAVPKQQIVRTPIAYYRLPEYDPDEVYDCPIDAPDTQAEVARLCAAYHNGHRDGWEMSWPLKIELVQVNEAGGVFASLGIWDVEREIEPVFSVRKSR